MQHFRLNSALANETKSGKKRQKAETRFPDVVPLHLKIGDGHRSSSDTPYLLRASLRQVCNCKSETKYQQRNREKYNYLFLFIDVLFLHNQLNN